MKAARTAVRLAPIVISVLCLMQVLSSAAAADGGHPTTRSPPAAVIELDELHITFDAAGNTSGVVTGNGTITNNARSPSGRLDHSVVELEAVSASGWPVAIEPSEMKFPPDGGPRRFNWTVTVPLNATVNMTDTVTFSGSVTIFPPGTRSARIPERTVTVEVLAAGGPDGDGGGGGNTGKDLDADRRDGATSHSQGRSYAAPVAVLAILLLPFIVSHAVARRRRAPPVTRRERRAGRQRW